MGLWDKLKGEIIDIIDWTDNTNDTVIYKFPRFQNEIKMGAQLTVRESQVALFLNEGTIADVFQPGMHTLSTQNMPILSTLKGWKYGFNSPFKADVFFVSTKQFTNQKWGTKNPFMVRDPEFQAVRIRAFGSYNFRVNDAAKFFKEIAGTSSEFTVDEVNEYLRNLAVSRGTDAIASSKIPILDLASNYDEVSKVITEKVKPEFNEIGVDITKFLIENISLPENVEKKLDARSEMNILGGDIESYKQMMAADAIKDAANNAGGTMIGAMGMGMMGNMFQQNNAGQNQQMGNPNMPPPPPMVQFFVAVNGAQTGPFSIQQLQAMAMSGQFNRQSLVWKQGMSGWLAAETQAELSAVFGAMPPPPPPIG